MRTQMPTNFVSIITVNFNGKKYLKDFLSSAFLQDYPKEEYEVLVVDNGSTDDSNEYIKKNFPKTKIVKSKRNLGFGRGNNLGMKHAKGGLFLLVNNDTILGRDTLTSLVDLFNKQKGKVGAIAAKLVLVDSYLPITIEEAYFSGHTLPKIVKPYNPDPYVISHDSGNLFNEKIFLPLNYDFEQDVNINLQVKPFRRNEFKAYLGEKLIFKGYLKSLVKSFDFNLNLDRTELVKNKKNLIQNAGNFFFRDGSGRDRGALVIKHAQYYEVDSGQYDKEEIIPAFCGAGVLLNKKALEEVGYFDTNFFMYYEDSDLSFRLRERNWKIVYNPKSIIRHVHAGSSKEWSDFFTFNAERGRLLFLSKHWPRFRAITQLIKYFAWDTLGMLPYALVRMNWEKIEKRFLIRLKVCVSIALPFLIGLLRGNRIKYSEFKGLL
jgi:GT2 family glycosyltransferase